MINQRIDSLARLIAIFSIFIVSCGNAWAASGICTYTESGAGIGGTGISGSGIGGTGNVAKGSGIGGTGIRPEAGNKILRLAGNVVFSEGFVEAQSDGRARLLVSGDPVCVGETIVTPQSATVEIRMTDGASITVRPQTHLKIEKYVFSGTKKDNSLLALLKGACRIITGKIGKQYPQNDLIKTPTVLIGIRGTDHEATVILPGSSASYPSGTYDKVNQGITFIRTEKGEIDIHPNQVGYAASAGELPTLLKDMPVFYKASPSMEHKENLSKEGGKERSESPGKHDQSDRHEPAKSSEHHELPGSPEVHERPESPEAHERPEPPEVHELPGIPETPEMPELPETPEMPELPGVHGISELPEVNN